MAKRPQTQKDRALNRARYEAMSQLASEAQPPRNRYRYSRADFRNRANRGIWED